MSGLSGQVRLRFSAGDLPKTGAYLQLAIGDGIDWIDDGYKTEVVEGTLNPTWSTTFILNYDMENPAFMATVFDTDDQQIGTNIFFLHQLAGGTHTENLFPAGTGDLTVNKF